MVIEESRVTRLTAMKHKKMLTAAVAQGDTELDWQKVTSVDSSAVSLSLTWIRQVQAQGGTPTLKSVPQKLISLMALYGVKELVEPFFA